MNDYPWEREYRATRGPNGLGYAVPADEDIIAVTGRDSASFLQGMVTSDALALAPGDSGPSAILDSSAHVQAIMQIDRLPDRFWLSMGSGCIGNALDIFEKHRVMEKARFERIGESLQTISLQGEGAAGAAKFLRAQLPQSRAFMHRRSSLSGWDWIGSSDDAARAVVLLDEIGAARLEHQAVEALRIEAGIPSWGREIDSSTLLPEAGWDAAVSRTKGCYLGQEIVARVDARGRARRQLRAVLFPQRSELPPVGSPLHRQSPETGAWFEAGKISSVAPSPHFGARPLALAVLRREACEPGQELRLALEDESPEGIGIVRLPGK